MISRSEAAALMTFSAFGLRWARYCHGDGESLFWSIAIGHLDCPNTVAKQRPTTKCSTEEEQTPPPGGR